MKPPIVSDTCSDESLEVTKLAFAGVVQRLVEARPRRQKERFKIVPHGQVIDIKEYQDARSLQNPEGQWIKAEAFANLVDKSVNVESVDAAYGLILKSANVDETMPEVNETDGGTSAISCVSNDFCEASKNYRKDIENETRNSSPDNSKHYSESFNLLVREGVTLCGVLENVFGVKSLTRKALAYARQIYDNTSKGSFTPGCGACTWHISFANPFDWAEEDGPKSVSPIVIRPNQAQPSELVDAGRVLVETGSPIDKLWSPAAIDNSCDCGEVEISVDLFVVEIERPWFFSQIFDLPNWHLSPPGEGIVSDGNWSVTPDSNRELLSEIPVAFIVARDVQVISLGGGERCNIEAETDARIVGWIYQIIPLSPKR